MSGQAQLVYVKGINHNIPTTTRWTHGDVIERGYEPSTECNEIKLVQERKREKTKNKNLFLAINWRRSRKIPAIFSYLRLGQFGYRSGPRSRTPTGATRAPQHTLTFLKNQGENKPREMLLKCLEVVLDPGLKGSQGRGCGNSFMKAFVPGETVIIIFEERVGNSRNELHCHTVWIHSVNFRLSPRILQRYFTVLTVKSMFLQAGRSRSWLKVKVVVKGQRSSTCALLSSTLPLC